VMALSFGGDILGDIELKKMKASLSVTGVSEASVIPGGSSRAMGFGQNQFLF